MAVFLVLSLILSAAVFKMTAAQMASDSTSVFSNSIARAAQEYLNLQIEKMIKGALKDGDYPEDEDHPFENVSISGQKANITGLSPKIEELRASGEFDKAIAMLKAEGAANILSKIPINEFNQLRNSDDSTNAFYDFWLFNAKQEVVVNALSGENTYEINAQALNKAQTSGVSVTHEQSFPTESIISSLILPKQQQLFFPLYADGAVVSILVVAIPQSRFDYFTGHHYNLSIYILTLILVGLLLFYYLTKYISKDHRALELYIDRLSKGDIPAIPSIKQRKLAIGIAKLRKSLVKVSRIDKNLQDRSHDIYNKVYNIQTTADNILKTKDINQQQRFISNIQQDAIDLEESIEKILLQAKGDQRENLSSPELVSSMNLVTDVLGDNGITNALEKKKINIKTSNLGIEMKIEYNDVYNALINLIHNAITATGTGSTIEIKLQHTNKWIRLYVLDMGPGIPHNFSLDSYLPNSSDKKSHGLGLPLVARVMQRHEGEFELKNRTMVKGAEAILKFPKY